MATFHAQWEQVREGLYVRRPRARGSEREVALFYVQLPRGPIGSHMGEICMYQNMSSRRITSVIGTGMVLCGGRVENSIIWRWRVVVVA